MGKIVRISNLTAALGRSIGTDKISLDINKGELCVLLGANGSGKTTLLRCMTGLLQPKSGSIKIMGEDILRLNRTELARLISYVPQGHRPVFSYSVFDTVLAGRSPHVPLSSGPGPIDFEVTENVLKELGLWPMANRPYTQLSGGERQLTLLARGLTQSSPVMLLDEPTAYLDYHNQHLILESVKNLVKEHGLTAIVSLHDPNLALEYGDRLVMLHDKKICVDLKKDNSNLLKEFEVALQIAYRPNIRIVHADGLAFVVGH